MGKRRVLWFVNKVPRAVDPRPDAVNARGGWLDEYIALVRDEQGIELIVAFPDWTGSVREVEVDGVTFLGMPTGAAPPGMKGVLERWRHEATAPSMVAAATDALERFKPDLIHLHGAELCFGLGVIGRGVPTVLSAQGSPTVIRRLYTRGVDRYFLRSIRLDDLLKGRGPVHELGRLRSQAANEAAIMSGVDHIAGRTEWDARLSSIMAPQAKYHHCDELMRSEFHDAEWSRAAARPCFVVATAGHYAIKGVGTLLEAMNLVGKARPEATLQIAGVFQGSVHQRATERHIRALGLTDRVTVLGEVGPEVLARGLLDASVFVSASHIENSSNALSEAQLAGVPCVASAAGGTPSLAAHGAAALLFQDGDAVGLAGAVLAVLDDPHLAERLSEEGRRVARRRHDSATVRAQLLEMYGSVLGGQ